MTLLPLQRHLVAVAIGSAVLLPAFALGQTAGYSLTVPGEVTVGSAFSVSWTAPETDDLTRDWVGIFRAGDPDTSYIAWQYTETPSGAVDFVVLEAGTYEARYFKNDGQVRMATSGTFVAREPPGGGGGGPTGPYTLTAPTAEVITGESFPVVWSAPSGDNLTNDWVGISQAGTPDSSYVAWQYVSGPSGSLTFSLSEAGTYEARYFKNDGFEKVATSASFVVKLPSPGGGGEPGIYTLTVPASEVELGAAFTVSWSAPQGENLNQDWIGLFRAGESDTSYVAWEYVTGQTGSHTFTLSTEGTYEARYFKNDGFQKVATSAPFTIVPSGGGGGTHGAYTLTAPTSEVALGIAFGIAWSAPEGDNLSSDWIGIFRDGEPDSAYVTWQYVSGASGELTFSLFEPGTYEARYFKNNGFTKVATSATFTVSTSSGGGGEAPIVTLAVTPETTFAGESVLVSWTAEDAGLLDWIGLYEVGASDSQYLEWKYTALRNGDTRFVMPGPGLYEFRYFRDNSFVKLAVSRPVFVLPPLPDPSLITNYPPQGVNNIALGNSIIEGGSASPGEDFVSELSRRVGEPIINAGKRGDSTREALARLEEDVLSKDPKVVIVLLGGVDFLEQIRFRLRNIQTDPDLLEKIDAILDRLGVPEDPDLIPTEETFNNIRTIIDRIHERGGVVLLLGLDGIFGERFGQEYVQIAIEKRTAFVPDVLAGIIGNPLLTVDLLHPNDAGYDLMASRVEPMMELLLAPPPPTPSVGGGFFLKVLPSP
jgi:lysophospholipase L1-like esterase